MISVSEAIADPRLLGNAFAGSSLRTRAAASRAAEGLPLNDDQHRDFARVAEREPPARRVRELWVIAGRRSGKDSVASAIATTAAMGDSPAHLRPGWRARGRRLAGCANLGLSPAGAQERTALPARSLRRRQWATTEPICGRG